MESINTRVEINRLELKQLKEQEKKHHESIVNNFLLIQLLMIYFNALTFMLNNEIKSTLVKNYLKLARKCFNENFELVKDKKIYLRLMDPVKNRRLKNALKEENEFIRTLVRNLNKVFIIQYDDYSWTTFNDFYVVNDDKIATIDKNIEKMIAQTKAIKLRIGHLASFNLIEKIDLSEDAFLPLEEKSVIMIPLFLHLTRKK